MVTAEKVSFSGTSITSSDPDFIDIDSDKKDPQLCSLYAPDIYNNLRVVEVGAMMSFLSLYHFHVPIFIITPFRSIK